ncbi:hypothetical protein [Zooshikella harenae]|uniref:Transmembrane protein n=1 Tax=Zooshikella harenae TaxID=2827238 RepID=A0ABS5ZDU0_9GAMM|nr:hypothetical protein [Zooshikella harenae]MBU2711481.1 hypothetical protein [Zooshikella harenae]
MKLTIQLLLLSLVLLALHFLVSKLHIENTSSFTNSLQLISTESHIHSAHSQIDHIIEEHETSSDDCHGCYGNCSPLTKYKDITVICNTNLYCVSQPSFIITGYYALPFRPPIIFHV